MANKLNKAHKIVNKATATFSDAISQVELANDILRDGIRKDNEKLDLIEDQIKDLKFKKECMKLERADKSEQIISNNGLITKLKEFTN